MEEETKLSTTVSTEFRHAEFSQQSIRETLDELHSKASSVLLLTLQWKDLERHFVRMRDSIMSGATEVQSLQASLKVAQESIDSRVREVEAKEKELKRIKEAVDERYRSIERAEESAREVDKMRVEVEGKLRELGEKERIHATSEAIEERRRAIEVIERDVNERMREFEVKEKELEECLLKFDREKNSFEERVREFGLKQERFEEQSRVHEQKVNQFAKRVEELESKEKKFEERVEDLELKEKQFEQRCKAFEANVEGIGDSKSKKRKFSDNRHCKGEIESPGPCNEDRNSVDGSVDANLHFCVTMDGKALQIFLNERWKEHDLIRSEVFVALQMSSNPGKLVLDAMQGFYPPHLKNEDTEFEGNVVMQSCILLLEQLMKISPPIEPNLKKEAMKLAFDWITKMRVDAYHSLQVLGFLLLLASYELAPAFDSDELLSYFEVVAQHSQAPELLSALGLADKIHGVIQNLISKKHIILAVRFIYALELVDEFPPVPLLHKCLDSYEELSRNSNSKGHLTLEEQREATNRRLTDLKSLVKCIEECNLESKFPFKSLEESVAVLEEEMKNGKPDVPHIRNNSQQPIPDEELCKSPTLAQESASISASTPVPSQTISPVTVPLSKPLSKIPLQNQSSRNCCTTGGTDEYPLNLIGGTMSSVPSVETTFLPETILSTGQGGTNLSHLKMAQPCYSHSDSTLAPSSPTSQPEHNCFPVKVDGEGLRWILSEHENDYVIRGKVSVALEDSADPAKLVFDAVKGEGFKLGVSKEHCILLLEQLRKFSPLIKPHVKEEALKFANGWKEKLLKQDQLEVVCVLQFIATYGLASSVNGNELLCPLGPRFWDKRGPNLCNVLGLADLTENFIRSLIGKNQRLKAMKVIRAVEMIDKFPLVPMLKDHLHYINNKAEILCKTKKIAGVLKEQISQLRGVKKYILRYKLECQISVKAIEEQILQLEKQIAKELQELDESKLKSEVSSKSESLQNKNKKKRKQRSTTSSTAPVVSSASGPPSITASTPNNRPKMRQKMANKSPLPTPSQHFQHLAGSAPRHPHQWPEVAARPHHYHHQAGPFSYAGAPHWEQSARPHTFPANVHQRSYYENVRPHCHRNRMGEPSPSPHMNMPFGRF